MGYEQDNRPTIVDLLNDVLASQLGKDRVVAGFKLASLGFQDPTWDEVGGLADLKVYLSNFEVVLPVIAFPVSSRRKPKDRVLLEAYIEKIGDELSMTPYFLPDSTAEDGRITIIFVSDDPFN